MQSFIIEMHNPRQPVRKISLCSTYRHTPNVNFTHFNDCHKCLLIALNDAHSLSLVFPANASTQYTLSPTPDTKHDYFQRIVSVIKTNLMDIEGMKRVTVCVVFSPLLNMLSHTFVHTHTHIH